MVEKSHPPSLDMLAEQLTDKRRVWVLTGAGISAPSGLPTYRDHLGNWQHTQPIQHQQFIADARVRQRYWARSAAGWQLSERFRPNAAHEALTTLQNSGRVTRIVTQNVDRLHSAAGSREVIDLHGRIDQIVCLDCASVSTREHYQVRLLTANPGLENLSATIRPDGDAELQFFDETSLRVPACERCGGVLMPDLVFFGGTVPRERVDLAMAALERSDCVLVLGSSLTVYSGFRFIRRADELDIPLYAINQGTMRGIELFDLVVPEPLEAALPALITLLSSS